MVKSSYCERKGGSVVPDYDLEAWSRYRAKLSILQTPGFLSQLKRSLPAEQGWDLHVVTQEDEPRVFLKLTRHLSKGQTFTSAQPGKGVELTYSQCLEVDCRAVLSLEVAQEMVRAAVNEHPRWVKARLIELLSNAGLDWR